MGRRRFRFVVPALAAILLATNGAFGPPAASAVGPDPIRYTYDANGRLSSVIDPAAGSAAYGYDATGNITSITRRASTATAILEVSPDSGPAGTTVAIDGTGFSATPSQNTVKFNGVTATVVSSTTTEIVATVPATATTGTISVTAPSGNATSPTTFTVGSTAPTITSFTPSIGVTGTSLTITGTKYETTTAANAVRLNSQFAKVNTATATSLNVTTPPASTGHVSVATPGGTVTSSGIFFVPPSPRVVTDIDDTKSVALGSSVAVTVTNAGNDALIAFDGTLGQRVATLFGTVSLAGKVTILSPDGSVLRAAQTIATGTFFDAVTLPATGTYTLWVDGNAGATGSVNVQVYGVTDVTGSAAIGGAAVTQSIPIAGQNGSLTFDGTAGQRASWLFTNVTIASLDVTILAPDGSTLRAKQDTNTSTFFDVLTLPTTGTYRLVADPRTNSTGAYTVTIYNVPADPTASATIGGPAVAVTTTVPGQNAAVTFSATGGQRASWLFSSVTLSNAVSILNPDGTTLRNPQGVGNGTLFATLTLAQTGTYKIFVNGSGASTGSLSVQVQDQGMAFAPGGNDFANAVLAGYAQLATAPAWTPEAASDRAAKREQEKPQAPPKPPPATGPEEWTPTGANLRGDWTSGRPRSGWEDQPHLYAEPGATALSGLVLDLRGEPLANVTLELDEHETTTDASGRFLLADLDTEAAAGTLEIDGSTANRPGRTYGFFEVRVELAAGQTTALPYTIWLPKLDTAHTIAIPAVTDHEVVVTTPKIPGLELHIPAGASITDEHGEPVTEIGITAIPIDRTPFPLPINSIIPVYFTIQPGGAYVEPDGAWLVYPNYINASPNARIDFFQYDPDDKGWFVYGHGTVTADGRSVVPDADTRLWEFTGAMINDGNQPPGTGPNGEDDGDPVDLNSGLFVLSATDLALPGVIGLSVTRTYRPNDVQNRAFGKGTNWNFGMFLWSAQQYQQADLVLPTGAKVHYVRTSPGTSWTDAVFETTTTPDAYYKSTIVWNGNGWDLRLRDGTVYVFGENAPLQSIRDRYGNRVNLIRSSGGQTGNVVRLAASSGRWITLAYDASNRITSVTDNTGRTVGYTYDAAGYLWKVTNPAGGVTEYTYDAAGRMKTLKDARLITFLTNDYDANGRVQKQTQADGSTYLFAYTTDANGKVVQTDVTDPRSIVRRLTYDAAGFSLTDTRAFGTAQAETTTYVRQASGSLPTSVTDALGRRTDFAYDGAGNTTSITRLAGTTNAATTLTTYDPAFNQVRTITDPLNRTTTFEYNGLGQLIRVIDPRQKVTAYTYNPAGQGLTLEDATGKITSSVYTFGDLTATIDPLGNRANRFVDAAGRVAAVTDAIGNRARTDYDVLNRPTAITDPLAGKTQFTYDANGNPLTITDPRNGVTTYTYDSMDRVATAKDALL
ncbi:MAG TPA: IPT/TIG domain-containing protein, partial [Candidatus Limnocylindrales bacterium]|nr:IPT/TIG domain-containing protein [Candidatus Limnocylindrales bacterium]